MKIQNAFHIPLPPAEAWKLLNDVPRVATCVPGAHLIGQNDDGSYNGTVAVRLGPVALSFKGKFAYTNVDEANHAVTAEASGTEQKARGTARGVVMFKLEPDGSGTHVAVDTDVQLAGSIAQYARGGSLIETTAQVLMDQFACNLAEQLSQSSAAAVETSSEDVGMRDVAGTRAASTAPRAAPQPSAKPPQAISGFALMLQTMRYTLRRWFGGSAARRR